ncbi:MAG: dihydroorotate dehydrogenase (quinone) [Rhodospirillales bacterium]|jgi:dihydroorotate dehydrogenase|uniref:quinone-dependent dihydroorotate dehydrogenase n=1 Tax=Hwanghaeella sp. 1Z406 TaxID=3402811 RepID=UPI000C98A7C0|nr:dihydroorotate dehydrogenase (quinone) [Rhodospirillales bacterium]|tara:strand:- start:86581 stop:87642 length:1062 start_codon:yes stop_codon:yes gene_type:complete
MALTDYVLPLLHRLDPERAHRLTVRALACGFGPKLTIDPDPCLANEVFGLKFATPIGLAAGFDKDAEAVRACLALGFGFVEIGTVTPRPQGGNPKPRLFRLTQDMAVINRMGFNNAGADRAATRLAAARAQNLPGPVGVNIGKNKDSEDAAADYAACATRLAPYADYVTINVSSPNTPGLRALQSPDQLRVLVAAVRDAAATVGDVPPILVKIAPDLEEADLRAISAVGQDPDVAGLIISNTTTTRPDTLRDSQKGQIGGLSGAPLFERSTEVLRRVYALTEGKVPLIGVGGVASAEDAYAKIRAGASLVQLYSALVYTGPELIGRITQTLPELLRADGFTTLAQAIGADFKD